MERFADDGVLRSAVLRGEPGAAEALFDRIFDDLWGRVCARLDGDRQAAEEVIGDALGAGLRALAGFRGEASLSTWFYRIALRKIADRRRGRACRLLGGDGALEAILDERASPEAGTLDRLADEDLRREVTGALESLPDHHRRILEWKYLEASSVVEVASRLRVSPKAVERRLARARRALAGALRRRGIRSGDDL